MMTELVQQMRRDAAVVLAEKMTLEEFLDLSTAVLIMEALESAKGNRCKAAKILGIHRNTLLRQMKQAQIADKFPRRKSRKWRVPESVFV